MRIAFVGGTGPAGFGLAERFASAGHEVVVGSRRPEHAEEIRAAVLAAVPGASASSGENQRALDGADVVFLTVPFDVQRATVESLREELAGKVVVSIANPIRVAKRAATVDAPEAGSLAEEVAALVPDARVVSALHEINVKRFSDLAHGIEADTIVTGDDEGAKKIVMGLIRQIPGMRPIDGGSLENSGYVERFVAVLISINFRYRASASYRITGLPEGDGARAAPS